MPLPSITKKIISMCTGNFCVTGKRRVFGDTGYMFVRCSWFCQLSCDEKYDKKDTAVSYD